MERKSWNDNKHGGGSGRADDEGLADDDGTAITLAYDIFCKTVKSSGDDGLDSFEQVPEAKPFPRNESKQDVGPNPLRVASHV